jgi:hypothetical protein
LKILVPLVIKIFIKEKKTMTKRVSFFYLYYLGWKINPGLGLWFLAKADRAWSGSQT